MPLGQAARREGALSKAKGPRTQGGDRFAAPAYAVAIGVSDVLWLPTGTRRHAGKRSEPPRAARLRADPNEKIEIMSAGPKSAPKTEPAGADGAAPAPVSWPSRGSRRGHAPLRLLGALRGNGVMVWSGGEEAVAYELDVFGAGEARSASGALEGDFIETLTPEEGAGAVSPPITARLRLQDGREIGIDIAGVEPPMAQFDVRAADAGGLWPPIGH